MDLKLEHIDDLEMTPEQEAQALHLYNKYFLEPYLGMPDLTCNCVHCCGQFADVGKMVDIETWD